MAMSQMATSGSQMYGCPNANTAPINSGLSGNTYSPNPSSPALSSTSSSSGSGSTIRSEPPKRLRYWLIDMINSGTIPGLQWADNAQTIFRIPWKHAGKNNWKEEDCRIFKAWAEHRGKFKKGDKIDAATWKTRLRCALNKLPDIKELKEHSCLEGNEPYRVYQLLPEPDKTQSYEIYPRCTWGKEAFPGNQNTSNTAYIRRAKPEINNISSSIYNGTTHGRHKDARISHATSPTDPSKEFSRMRMAESMPSTANPSGFYVVNKLKIVPPEPLNAMPKSIHPSINYQERYFSVDQSSPQQAILASPTGSDVSTCSSALNMMNDAGYCENGKPGGTLSPVHTLLQEPQRIPEAHEMEIYIQYRGVNVLVHHVTEPTGCRVHYGDATIQHIAKAAYELPTSIFGPETLHQISLVDCEPYATSQKQITLTKHVLSNIKRGLILNYENGCFYARRLCQSRVFVLGPESPDNNPEKLDRSTKVKVFDYHNFCEKIRGHAESSDSYPNGHKVPEMEVKASFGQNWSIKTPIEKNLVTMYMIPRAAKFIVTKVREKNTEFESFGNSIGMSNQGSYDRLADEVMSESSRSIHGFIKEMSSNMDCSNQFNFNDSPVPDNQHLTYQSGFFQQNHTANTSVAQSISVMNDVEMAQTY